MGKDTQQQGQACSVELKQCYLVKTLLQMAEFWSLKACSSTTFVVVKGHPVEVMLPAVLELIQKHAGQDTNGENSNQMIQGWLHIFSQLPIA